MSEGAAPVDILIVDDNPLMTRLLAELLGDEGYRVVAIDGSDVIETALLHAPRLIMLDVLMPQLDGPELCQRLRADPRTAHVPIIFVSALPPATLALRLHDCPYDALIAKPFDLDEVVATVGRFLDRAGG
ncbi:MAG TPA: response regulator [Thermomicrobiales bacterium]|jgi:CheY-like chemotaxis protein